MPKDSLSITDNRTGATYEIPIERGTIRAMVLRKIKASPEDFGLMTYDPGYMNTASCRSAITYLDGEKGILRYRGYPVEQLAEDSTFLEVAYLLWHGELPSPEQYEEWARGVRYHTIIHESFKKLLDAFRYDAHPMGIFVSCISALSTFYPDSRKIDDPFSRLIQYFRMVSKVPTLAAFAYRHSIGMPYVYPDNTLGYTENLLNMMFAGREPLPGQTKTFEHSPVLSRALDVLFILHADHEQNCSTACMRGVGSAHTDPYCSVAAGAAALYGPLHGGANEAVLRMLSAIGSVEKIPEFIKSVKAGERRLMGFGHRVYKSYDPRAKVIKGWAHRVFEVTGHNPLLDIALELERIALEDEYFLSRKLYPNVDFYSGLIYQAMGFPTDAFPVLFAIPRAAGWMSQWNELLGDADQKIARPRQVYTGPDRRDYVPLEKR